MRFHIVRLSPLQSFVPATALLARGHEISRDLSHVASLVRVSISNSLWRGGDFSVVGERWRVDTKHQVTPIMIRPHPPATVTTPPILQWAETGPMDTRRQMTPAVTRKVPSAPTTTWVRYGDDHNTPIFPELICLVLTQSSFDRSRLRRFKGHSLP